MTATLLAAWRRSALWTALGLALVLLLVSRPMDRLELEANVSTAVYTDCIGGGQYSEAGHNYRYTTATSFVGAGTQDPSYGIRCPLTVPDGTTATLAWSGNPAGDRTCLAKIDGGGTLTWAGASGTVTGDLAAGAHTVDIINGGTAGYMCWVETLTLTTTALPAPSPSSSPSAAPSASPSPSATTAPPASSGTTWPECYAPAPADSPSAAPSPLPGQYVGRDCPMVEQGNTSEMFGLYLIGGTLLVLSLAAFVRRESVPLFR